MNTIVCKEYTPADRQIVFDISKISNLEPYDISELDDLYHSWPDGQYLAYNTIEKKIVGFILGKKHDAHTNRIYMFAILPEYRSRGIGQMMLDKFYSISEYTNSDVILEVRTTNIRAKKLYDSNNFIEICRIKGLYASGEEAIRMKRVIK